MKEWGCTPHRPVNHRDSTSFYYRDSDKMVELYETGLREHALFDREQVRLLTKGGRLQGI